MSDKPVVIADPGPLGLSGFGLTTVILSLINANFLPASIMTTVLALALVYGGSAQLLAGMWEFRKGNTFGATAFTSYGAFWISFYWLINHLSAITPQKDVGIGVGIYLLMWGVFSLYMFFGTFYANKALFYIFLFLVITFILLAIANFSSTSTVIGGWFGLITGVLALYTAAAGVINSQAGRVVWPVGSPILKSSNS